MGGFCVTEGTLNGRGKPCPVLRLSTQLQQVNGVSNTIGSMGGGGVSDVGYLSRAQVLLAQGQG